MEAAPFDPSHPAENISKLCEWLASNHRPDFLYRGQRQDFGALIPSSFRKLDLGKIGNYRLISSDGFFGGSATAQLQHRLMNDLIRVLGADLGSYICQQYFCFSQSLDFSESIAVAAFFATYVPPQFLAPLPSSENLGVIYRLDQSLFGGLKPGEHWRSGFLLDDPQKKQRELFVLRENPAAAIDGWRAEQMWFCDNTLRKFKPTLVEKHFAMAPRLFTVEDFVNSIVPYISRSSPAEARDVQNFFRHGSFPPIRYLRALVQRGAVVTPSTLWRSTVPLDLKGEHGRDIDLVWGEQCIGMEDVSQNQAITKYYFEHQGIPIENISREYLWPDRDDDLTLEQMIFWIGENLDARKDILLEDVVDFGYEG